MWAAGLSFSTAALPALDATETKPLPRTVTALIAAADSTTAIAAPYVSDEPAAHCDGLD